MIGRDWRRSIQRCPKGHSYDLLSTAWTRAGHRRCRVCERVRIRLRNRRLRASMSLAERHRHHGRDPATIRERGTKQPKRKRRLPWTDTALCVLLYLRDGGETNLGINALQYRARYRYDADYREREVQRTQRRKYGRAIRVGAASDGTLTPSVMQRLFAEARYCPYCRGHLTSRIKTLDHVIPLSRGGLHSIANVLICCHRCNSRKADLLPDSWLARLAS